MGRFQKCTKCVIALTIICIATFVVGVVLLVIGFLNYMSEPAPPPYMWSLNLCQIRDSPNHWVGYDPLSLVENKCPEDIADGNDQEFHVASNILGESIPYSVTVYVTNKVNGSFRLDHYSDSGEHVFGIFKTDLDTKEYVKEDFAICGGKSMTVFRNGPLNEDDGDYITYDCKNETSGCVYEPARSLSSYDLKEGPSGEQILHMKDISVGSRFVVSVDVSIPNTATGANERDFIPEVYVEYKVAGRGPQQDMGFILLIIGGILADVMPATLYFLLQKFYYKTENKLNNHEDTGIPLMELDDSSK